MKRGFSFEFQEPLGWEEFSEPGRVVFHGPTGEELIVSGSIVTGSGNSADFSAIREQLVANAIAAMRYAVDLPDLVTTTVTNEKSTANGLRRWDLVAKTADGQIEFYQSTVEGPDGVLLVSLEASPDVNPGKHFEEFVSQIRPVVISTSG